MFILLLLISSVSAFQGSYNSFINQIGFCKLQGFNTVSRNTSNSIPMFLDGRLSFGVGTRFVSTSFCGRCLRIYNIDRFAVFNYELDAYEYGNDRNDSVIDAIVFDQCMDDVCTEGYLDFDIYSITQPVQNGNPTAIIWEYTPCPILPGEFIEILFCLSNTCHSEDEPSRNMYEILRGADPHYWTIFTRNSRLPIDHVYLPFFDLELKDNNGWVYDHVSFNLSDPFVMVLNHQYHVTIDLIRHSPSDAYHGGIIVPTNIQN